MQKDNKRAGSVLILAAVVVSAGVGTAAALVGDDQRPEASISTRPQIPDEASQILDDASQTPDDGSTEAILYSDTGTARQAPVWGQFAQDLATSKAVAGQVSVGDSCDELDPGFAQLPGTAVALVPIVDYTKPGVCRIGGWAYYARAPADAPGTKEPDSDGFIPVAVYDDIGNVLYHMSIPDEARQQVRDYEGP